ncbi:hypothetical protein N431DRAFT_427282 [Stipitochalara longipes BDJ]|nr:hypothetical protein N431DRAFT_427282 [Stipitochalara longipes BDJ]
MSTCPKLKARVLAASFDWQDQQEPYGYDLKVEKVYRALAVLPSSVRIHVSPPQWMMDSVMTRTNAYGPMIDNFENISIDLNYSFWDKRDGVFLNKKWFPNRDGLYRLFRKSGLRHLSICGVRCWTKFLNSEEWVLGSSKRRTSFSNLETLMLPNTVPMNRDLELVLTWPKALKTFHMETWISPGITGFPPCAQGRPPLSPYRIVEALVPQSHSLEEIHIGGCYDDLGMEYKCIRSLQSFPRLKRLSIPQDYIFVGEDVADVDEPLSEIFARLRSLLPTTLEELQIQVDIQFNWLNADGSPTWNALELFVLINLLSNGLRFPALKKIALWQWLPQPGLPPFSPDILPGNIERNCTGLLKRLEADFSVPGFRIICTQSLCPPLFGGREHLKEVRPDESRWFPDEVYPLEDGVSIV